MPAANCPYCQRKNVSLRKCPNPKCGLVVCGSCNYSCPSCLTVTKQIY